MSESVPILNNIKNLMQTCDYYSDRHSEMGFAKKHTLIKSC